jgi:hypothetical protein
VPVRSVWRVSSFVPVDVCPAAVASPDVCVTRVARDVFPVSCFASVAGAATVFASSAARVAWVAIVIVRLR